MSWLWSLVSFIVAISVLVTVHEFGHYWVARRCGVKIERFSVGFGKVLFSRRAKNGTEFVLSAIPLGGYVKMLDERNEPVPENLRSQAFNNRPLWQRAAIVSAGPVANFLLAALLYTAIFMMGVSTVTPVIDSVRQDSIAAQAHLPAHSQIVAVDGEQVQDWFTVNLLLANKVGQDHAILTIKPLAYDQNLAKYSGLPNTAPTRNYELDLRQWHFDPQTQSAFGSLGIGALRTKIQMVVSKVTPNSPAAQAGLMQGDKLLKANGKALTWQTLVALSRGGKPFTLEVARGSQHFERQITPQKNAKGQYHIGIAPEIEPLPSQFIQQVQYGLWDALLKGWDKMWLEAGVTLGVIKKLLTGSLSVDNLSGPISIAKGAGTTAQLGLVAFLSFLGLISVNLGVMNLLPLPVLDGGHLLFLGAEAIKGKPLSQKTQDSAYHIGVIALLVLTAFALFNDFLRL